MAVKGIGRPLTIMLRADTDGLAKGLQSAEKQLQAFGKKTEVAARKATFALAGIGVAAFSSVQSASDLNESISKSEVIFGDSAKAIQSWAKTTDKSLGLSNTAALEAAGNFAILGSGAGLTGKELASFSTDLTGLAADLASFNNTSVDEAITALAAGLRGESEPLRKYGVLLDAATVEAKALEMNIGKTSKQITNQDKVLARNALILEATTKQQGDFARTADGAANQQRILAASVENTKAELGKGLLPVYQQLLRTLIPAVEVFSKNSKQIVAIGTVAAVAAVSIIALNAAVKISIALTKTYTAVMVIARTTTLFFAAATGSATAAQILAEATYKKSTIALVLYNTAQAITSAGARIAATSIGVLTLALLSNPFTAVAVAVAGLVTSLYLLNKTNQTTATKVESSYKSYGRGVVIFNKLNESAANASNSINRVSNAVQEARDVARSKGRNGLLDVNYTPDLVGLEDVQAAIGKVSKATEKQTKKQKEAEKAAKELAKATKTAEKIASGFASKLETARSSLDKVTQSFRDYRDSVKSAITSQFSFEEAFKSKGKNSFIESLKAQANAAKDFGAKIAKLVSLGLSRGGLDQIIQAGADVGGKIADELIAGGPGSIQNVNALVKSVDSVAGQIAKSTAGAFFDAGIEQGEALVAGIIQAAKNAGLIYSGGNIKLPKSAAGITNVAALNASASGLATTGSILGGAGSINITINGAVDPEGTRRQLEKLFQNSARRTGAVSLVGATL